MAMERWKPRLEVTKQETYLLNRLRCTRKLFAFLRDQRHVLFDEAFQNELENMYRDTGAGKSALPPALLAMAIIMQGYLGISDAEAVELTVVDLRWQLVLDRLGAVEPAFAQRTLFDFRNRLIAFNMDRRLLERTIELAKTAKSFDWKKLPKDLRVAIDSSPLTGAGRSEDTINLLAHAAHKVVECVAKQLGRRFDEVAVLAGIPLIQTSSVKRALDMDWSDQKAKDLAIDALARQVASLERYVMRDFAATAVKPPLKGHLDTLAQIKAQDLEPDRSRAGAMQIKKDSTTDRRISIEDADMRHGRKSHSKTFNGYKRHVVTDLDTTLVIACTVLPANKGEGEAAPILKDDIARQLMRIKEFHCDRAYVASEAATEIVQQGGVVICKPWTSHNTQDRRRFAKSDFEINLRAMTITCPAGEVADIELGTLAVFGPETCRTCPLRQHCTSKKMEQGRTVHINEDEHRQKHLRRMQGTRSGRERLRERVAVEHTLAHISQRQGNRARYWGTRKNVFDIRRAAVIQNLETIHRQVNAI